MQTTQYSAFHKLLTHTYGRLLDIIDEGPNVPHNKIVT